MFHPSTEKTGLFHDEDAQSYPKLIRNNQLYIQKRLTT